MEVTWYTREDLPWKALNDVNEVYDGNPTLVMGEALFYVCTLVAIWHAISCGKQHVLLMLASVVTGTANDIFFMYMPFVDNFFHAQFTIMLTPRLPLYIPCVYICFTYVSAATAMRLKLPPLAQAAACALSGGLYYSVYDLFGQKFLWWTWHDTDAAIFERWLGVPFGSTMWTLVHCFCFYFVLHHVALKYKTLSNLRFFMSLIVSALITTPFMMLSMSPFQMQQLKFHFEPSFEIDQLPGRPDAIALGLALVTFLALTLRGWSRRGDNTTYSWFDTNATRSDDLLLLVSAWLHFTSFAAMMLTCDPSTIVATGVHQEYGDCDVKMVDMMGFTRNEYLCKENYDEDFNFDCVDQVLPPENPEWFTVCGNPHKDFRTAALLECSLSLLGVVLYTYCMWNVGPSWSDELKKLGVVDSKKKR